MEKKICTITHHTVPNYGAVLQTYALQRCIRELGYDNEVLNYDEERVRRSYHYSFFAQRSIKEFIKHILYYKRYKAKIQVFKNFLKDYVKLSPRYTMKLLPKANEKYDLFITGSDQVWSLALHQGDTAYLLGFVEDGNKKGSYAASFGHESLTMIPEKYHKTYKKLLSDFRYVNVREKEGVALFEDFTGQHEKAVQVIDPTFLITDKEWAELEIKPTYDAYILIYCVNRYQELLKYAIQLSQKTGKKIINIQDGQQELPGVINLKNITVNAFLGLIHNADYVLTNSFHGFAFSVIFHRQFVFDYVHSKINSNSRIRSLAEMTGLENRELGKKDVDEKIDYAVIDNKLSNAVDFSKEKLIQMLEGK